MRDTLKKLRTALRPLYGNRETEAIIKLIFHYVKGWNTVDILTHEPDTLSPFIRSEIDGILKRLLNYEPIQYITGEARFHGLELHVTPDVLIPRPETSELVDIIVGKAGETPDLRVLDVATGSGCIAVALARALLFPKVTALDISAPALEVARRNAADLKVKVEFIEADIFTWTPDGAKYDIIVSNPPYIDESERASMERNVLDYEPSSALFVPDDDPLRFYRRITQLAASALVAGGRLYYEINPRHADQLAREIAGAGFSDVEIVKDSFGHDRFITAVKGEA
ncbi:MAG: peptide chain release factor N(5)-glutamine methyltransferase [Bacteroides sp.]|nr:peptide chain release factor N(5)-glutamine methyltransferase [Bacteroides sp.]